MPQNDAQILIEAQFNDAMSGALVRINNNIGNTIRSLNGLKAASQSGVGATNSVGSAITKLSKQFATLNSSFRSNALSQTALAASFARSRQQAIALEKSLVVLNNGGLNTAPIRAYISQLNAMNRMQKQIGNSMRMMNFKQMSTQMNAFAQRTVNAGNRLTMGLTLPLVAFFRVGFQSLKALDRQVIRTTKLMSDSFDELEKAADGSTELSRAISTLGTGLDAITSKWGVSRELVQGLAGDFAELGISSPKTLSRLTELTVEFEKLGNIDITESQKTVQALYMTIQRIRTDKGIAVTGSKALAEMVAEVNGAIAFFNFAENKTSLSMSNIAEAFPEITAAATSFGLNMQMTAAMLVPMIGAAFQTGASANSIKVSLQRMTSTTKQNKGMLEDLASYIGKDFVASLDIGSNGILDLVRNYDALQKREFQQKGTGDFMSRLFGVRQGPRMNVVIGQMAKYEKALKTAGSQESIMARNVEENVNAQLKLVGEVNDVKIKSFVDINKLTLQAQERDKAGNFTARALATQAGQQKALDSSSTQKNADERESAKQQDKKTVTMAKQNSLLQSKNKLGKEFEEIETEAGKLLTGQLYGTALTEANKKKELEKVENSLEVKYGRAREMGKDVARQLTAILGDVLTTLNPILDKVRKFIVALSPQTKKLIGVVLLALMALGPLMRIIGAVGQLGAVFAGARSKGIQTFRKHTVELNQSLLETTNIVGRLGGKFEKFGQDGKVFTSRKNARLIAKLTPIIAKQDRGEKLTASESAKGGKLVTKLAGKKAVRSGGALRTQEDVQQQGLNMKGYDLATRQLVSSMDPAAQVQAMVDDILLQNQKATTSALRKIFNVAKKAARATTSRLPKNIRPASNNPGYVAPTPPTPTGAPTPNVPTPTTTAPAPPPRENLRDLLVQILAALQAIQACVCNAKAAATGRPSPAASGAPANAPPAGTTGAVIPVATPTGTPATTGAAAPAGATAAKQARAETARLAKEARAEAARLAKETKAEAARLKAETTRLAKEARAEAARLAKETKAEAARLKAEAARLKAETKAEAARLKAETTRLAKEARAETARLAKETKAKATVPKPTTKRGGSKGKPVAQVVGEVIVDANEKVIKAVEDTKPTTKRGGSKGKPVAQAVEEAIVIGEKEVAKAVVEGAKPTTKRGGSKANPIPAAVEEGIVEAKKTVANAVVEDAKPRKARGPRNPVKVVAPKVEPTLTQLQAILDSARSQVQKEEVALQDRINTVLSKVKRGLQVTNEELGQLGQDIAKVTGMPKNGKGTYEITKDSLMKLARITNARVDQTIKNATELAIQNIDKVTGNATNTPVKSGTQGLAKLALHLQSTGVVNPEAMTGPSGTGQGQFFVQRLNQQVKSAFIGKRRVKSPEQKEADKKEAAGSLLEIASDRKDIAEQVKKDEAELKALVGSKWGQRGGKGTRDHANVLRGQIKGGSQAVSGLGQRIRAYRDAQVRRSTESEGVFPAIDQGVARERARTQKGVKVDKRTGQDTRRPGSYIEQAYGKPDSGEKSKYLKQRIQDTITRTIDQSVRDAKASLPSHVNRVKNIALAKQISLDRIRQPDVVAREIGGTQVQDKIHPVNKTVKTRKEFMADYGTEKIKELDKTLTTATETAQKSLDKVKTLEAKIEEVTAKKKSKAKTKALDDLQYDLKKVAMDAEKAVKEAKRVKEEIDRLKGYKDGIGLPPRSASQEDLTARAVGLAGRRDTLSIGGGATGGGGGAAGAAVRGVNDPFTATMGGPRVMGPKMARIPGVAFVDKGAITGGVASVYEEIRQSLKIPADIMQQVIKELEAKHAQITGVGKAAVTQINGNTSGVIEELKRSIVDPANATVAEIKKAFADARGKFAKLETEALKAERLGTSAPTASTGNVAPAKTTPAAPAGKSAYGHGLSRGTDEGMEPGTQKGLAKEVADRIRIAKKSTEDFMLYEKKTLEYIAQQFGVKGASKMKAVDLVSKLQETFKGLGIAVEKAIVTEAIAPVTAATDAATNAANKTPKKSEKKPAKDSKPTKSPAKTTDPAGGATGASVTDPINAATVATKQAYAELVMQSPLWQRVGGNLKDFVDTAKAFSFSAKKAIAKGADTNSMFAAAKQISQDANLTKVLLEKYGIDINKVVKQYRKEVVDARNKLVASARASTPASVTPTPAPSPAPINAVAVAAKQTYAELIRTSPLFQKYALSLRDVVSTVQTLNGGVQGAISGNYLNEAFAMAKLVSQDAVFTKVLLEKYGIDINKIVDQYRQAVVDARNKLVASARASTPASVTPTPAPSPAPAPAPVRAPAIPPMTVEQAWAQKLFIPFYKKLADAWIAGSKALPPMTVEQAWAQTLFLPFYKKIADAAIAASKILIQPGKVAAEIIITAFKNPRQTLGMAASGLRSAAKALTDGAKALSSASVSVAKAGGGMIADAGRKARRGLGKGVSGAISGLGTAVGSVASMATYSLGPAGMALQGPLTKVIGLLTRTKSAFFGVAVPIMLVVGAFFILKKSFNAWKDSATGVAENFKKAFGAVMAVVNMLKTAFFDFFASLFGGSKTSVGATKDIGETVSKVAEVVRKFAEGFKKYFEKYVLPAIYRFLSGLSLIIKSVFGIISNVIKFVVALVSYFRGGGDKAQKAMMDALKGILKGLLGILKGILKMLAPVLILLTNAVFKVVELIVQLFEFLVIGVINLIRWMVKGVINLIFLIIKAVVFVVDKIIDLIAYLAKGVVNIFLGMVRGITNVWFSILKGIVFVVQSIIDLISVIPAAIGSVFKSVLGFIAGIFKKLADKIPDWAFGIKAKVSGIADAIEGAGKSAEDTGQSIKGSMNRFLDPLMQGLQADQNTILDGLTAVGRAAMGVLTSLGNFGNSIFKSVQSAQNVLLGGVDKGADAANAFVGGFSKGIAGLGDDIVDWLNKLGENNNITEGIGKQIKEALEEEEIADPSAAEAAGKSIAEAIGEGLSSLKFNFYDKVIDNLSNSLGKLKDGITKALEKQKDQSLKFFDDQIKAIDALAEADAELTAEKQKQEDERLRIAERALQRDSYLKNRALAIYEGRIDDARTLGLEEAKNQQDFGKETEKNAKDADAVAKSKNRDMAKKVIEKEKEKASLQFDKDLQDFQDFIENIGKYGTLTKDELTTQFNELKKKADSTSAGMQGAFKGYYNALPGLIANNTAPTVGFFTSSMDTLIAGAQAKYGLDASVTDPGTMLGITNGMMNNMGTAYTTGFANVVAPAYNEGQTLLTGIATEFADESTSNPKSAAGIYAKAIQNATTAVKAEFMKMKTDAGSAFAQVVQEINDQLKGLAISKAISDAKEEIRKLKGEPEKAKDPDPDPKAPDPDPKAPPAPSAPPPIDYNFGYAGLTGVPIPAKPNRAEVVAQFLTAVNAQFKQKWTTLSGFYNATGIKGMADKSVRVTRWEEYAAKNGVEKKYNGGMIKKMISGGVVPGFSNQGVPAILHGGEYVINAKAVQNLGLGLLAQLNGLKNGVPSLNVPRPQMPNSSGMNINVSSHSQSETTQNYNFYVDNFIGEDQWFESMMKDYNIKVVPNNQKTAGLESRVIRTYNGINKGM